MTSSDRPVRFVAFHGQYCPIARGAEIFAERWTPLIIRNLHLGCETFGAILEGAPGLSRTVRYTRKPPHRGSYSSTGGKLPPLLYSRWNAASQAHAAAEPAQFALPATEGFYTDFEPDPQVPPRLASLTAPTLLVAGEYDIWPTATAVRQLAALMPAADMVVQPEAGHFPWVDDPSAFADSIRVFLRRQTEIPNDNGSAATSDEVGTVQAPPAR
jgi:pimeloyl-ACP methyl ester carboxylesterase